MAAEKLAEARDKGNDESSASDSPWAKISPNTTQAHLSGRALLLGSE